MTVKELITELLECNMDAEVNVLVEMSMEEFERVYSPSSYPIDDYFDIKRINERDKTTVNILLEEF